MSQKANPTSIRLNNRNSWATILNTDKRQFSSLFFADLQTRFFLATFLKFFSILGDKPIIKIFKRNSIYVQSSFVNKLVRKKILSSNQRIFNNKKLNNSCSNISYYNGLSRIHIYDFHRWKKKKLISVLAKKIKKSSFNLIRYNSAQMLGVYIGWQLESSFKQRDLNFKSNLKKGVGKTIQSFLKKENQNLICGIKIVCAGRWKKTKSGRKQIFTFSRGKLSTQSFSSFIDVGFYNGQTKYGNFSLKISIAYANK